MHLQVHMQVLPAHIAAMATAKPTRHLLRRNMFSDVRSDKSAATTCDFSCQAFVCNPDTRAKRCDGVKLRCCRCNRARSCPVS